MRRAWLGGQALVVVLVASCSVKLEPPSNADILCTVDGDCPPGWKCTKAGRCTTLGALDATSPGLVGDVMVTPTIVTRGGVATVRFQVSEELLGPPSVRIATGAATALTLDTEASAGTTYVFATPAASGAEPQDHACPITIELTDRSGNESGPLQGGQLSFDFVPPVILGEQVSGTPARRGGTVQVTFEVSEPLASDPVVTLETGSSFVKDPTSHGSTYVYTLVADGTEPEGAAGATIDVQLVDLAGNRAGAAAMTLDERATFDFTPPLVTSATVSLVPFSGCPLDAVSKVALGSSAAVRFVVSEPLGGDPVIGGQSGTWRATKVSGAAPALYYEYDVQLTGGSPTQGAQSLYVTLTDALGNESAPQALASVDVDTVPPTPVTPAQSDGLLYRRAPWGSQGTGGERRFSVQVLGADPVVEPDAWAIFTDGPTLATARELGRAHADGSGVLADTSLTTTDVAELYVSEIDGACNSDGAPVLLKNVEWTATMGFKRPGSTAENPFVFRQVPLLASTLSQDPVQSTEPSAEGLAELVAIDGQVLRPRAEGAWQQLSYTSASPPSQIYAQLAYDSARGKIVLHRGGVSMYEPAPEQMWEWDGTTWVLRTSIGVLPPPRRAHAMVYDSVRGRMVIFGGQRGNTTAAFDDMWEWDADTGEWSELVSAGDRPEARMGHSMVYDGQRGKIVLFGGAAYGSDGSAIWFQDVWEWDSARATWAKRPAPDPKPAGRAYAAMAYDSTRRRVVLFGGAVSVASNWIAADGPWEWDGDRGEWDGPLASVHGPPPALRAASAVFDRKSDKVLLYDYQELWQWDGVDWTGPITAAAMPSNRAFAGMAHDHLRGVTVLFGGAPSAIHNPGEIPLDTWEWNGSSWADRTPTGQQPSARYSHSITYDGDRDAVVLFGGWANAGAQNDTWEWKDGRWLPLSPAAHPPATVRASLTYDGTRHRALLVGTGGATQWNSAYEWDGTNWTGPITLGTPPSTRTSPALALDAGTGKVVLFGGQYTCQTYYSCYAAETWTTDGTNWTGPVATSSIPLGRNDAAMAYDGARGNIVMFGGTVGPKTVASLTRLQDTWTWDGSNWSATSPANMPPKRYTHALFYDSARKKVVLFGGSGEDVATFFNDTWEWDGADWTDRTPTGKRPIERVSSTPVFVPTLGKALLFGGYCSPVTCSGAPVSDTWLWDGGAAGRPAGLLQAGFAFAGAPRAVMQSIAATFWAGASGSVAGVPLDGAELVVWDEGAWKSEVDNTSGPTTPGRLQWITVDPATMERVLFGLDRTLNLAVRPRAFNGEGHSELAIDYAEVVFRYRLP